MDILKLESFDRITTESKYYTAILTGPVLLAENILAVRIASPRFALLQVCCLFGVFFNVRGP